jgi:predicted dehydrogenase
VDDLLALDAHVVESVQAAAALEPELGVVAGPATLHRTAAEAFTDAGAHLLVEKPLAADLHDGWAILHAAQRHRRTLLLGYHLRFSDTSTALIRAVTDGIVGRPVELDLHVGQHLGQWRPGNDPETSVSARHELGGGVLLELSHELDALLQLAGPIKTVEADLGYSGAPTDGRVETEADLEVTSAEGTVGRVHLDMVQQHPRRRWTVRGTEGSITADLVAGRVTLSRVGHSEVELASFEPGERDRAERRLIAHMLSVAAGESEPACTGSDGIAVLSLIEAARRSATSGRREPVGAEPTRQVPTA